jgi:hypothetical protein
LDSIRDAVLTFDYPFQNIILFLLKEKQKHQLTVSPNKQYRGIRKPTTPATHGPE